MPIPSTPSMASEICSVGARQARALVLKAAPPSKRRCDIDDPMLPRLASHRSSELQHHEDIMEQQANDVEPAGQPVEIFYLCAHEDERLVTELRKHLCMLKRQVLISPWYDGDILPGADWSRVH